jgi:hypothetical protein
MTRSIRFATGCCVLSALLSTALAGCGSSSAGSAPLTTAHEQIALFSQEAAPLAAEEW